MDKKVSVVMPLYNEEKHIEECILSLLQQDYPQDQMEWFFIDGCSQDGTAAIIEKYRRQYPDLIRLLSNPHKTVPYAMNIGIKAAQGEYIIRLDAHSEYARDYISCCVRYLEKTGADNVGGPMIAAGRNLIGQAFAHIHMCPFGLGGGKFHNPNYEGAADTVYLGAFKKATLIKVGLYDERLTRNQDIELNSRILKSGGKVYLTPQIKSTYYCRDSIRGLVKQNFNNGKWNIYTKLISQKAMSLRHFIPLIFLLSIVVLYCLSFAHAAFLYLLMIDIILYLVSNLFFSIKLALREKSWLLHLYLIIFPILHLSYGFGSLIGMGTLAEKKKLWRMG